MALHRKELEWVNDVFLRLKQEAPLEKGAAWKALLLSYPDLIVSPDALVEIFGERVQGKLTFRDDTEDVLGWHKAHHITRQVVETVGLFNLLRFDVDVVDITRARGPERFCDLNEPLEEQGCGHLVGRYDLVVDNVLDHCFNSGQAMKNIAGAVRQGGYVFHVTPLYMCNHGFNNFSPTYWFDFYGANGFSVVRYEAFEGVKEVKRVLELHPHHRPRDRSVVLGGDSIQLVLARRDELREKFVWPVQYKFRQNPDSKR